MDKRIEGLTENFKRIDETKGKIDKGLQIVQKITEKLRKIHKEFQRGAEDELQVLALDGLQFQNKYFEIDLSNCSKMRNVVCNRMYGDYYKIYKQVFEYLIEHFGDSPLSKKCDVQLDSFPVYKDLEINKVYEPKLVKQLQVALVEVLTYINESITKKNDNIASYNKKKAMGLNINNFVTMFAFNANLMKGKLEMFSDYIDYIIEQHEKYFERLYNRVQVIVWNAYDEVDVKNIQDDDKSDIGDEIPKPTPMSDASKEKVDEAINT